jgi:hypothetical protein
MKKQFISTEIVNWAQEVLQGHGYAPLVDVGPVVETAYSCVQKLSCGGDIFYLKKTPPTLFIEAEIINFLRKECGVTSIPEIIGQNKLLNCFLMKPSGEESLRTLFSKKTFDMPLLLLGVENYKAIQKATEKSTGKLMDMGVPDWRLPQMSVLYKNIVHDYDFLKRCGMTPDQDKRLQELQGTFSGLCEELAAFGMPDCLNHSDFQENNMLIDKSGRAVSIIDWGEVTIGNPLLPLATFLSSFSKRNSFDADTYRAAEESFFGGFFSSSQDMSRAVAISRKLSPIHYICTLRNLEKFMQQTSPRLDSRMNMAFGMFLGLCG